MQDSVDSKLVKLVTADNEEPMAEPLALPGDVKAISPESGESALSAINFSNRALAEAVIKKLSADEFLQVMEGASADELDSLLKTLDAVPQQSDSVSKPSHLRRLFEGPAQTSVFEIVGWWEARRLPYNILVGLAGLVTVLVWDTLRVATLSSLFWPAIAYGIAANVCYTSGWMAELFARRFFKDKAQHFGPILFAIGLLFSIVITLLPSFLAIVFGHI